MRVKRIFFVRFRVISWIVPWAERKSMTPNSDNPVSRRTLGAAHIFGTGILRFRVISVPVYLLEVKMRRLVFGLILVALNWTAILAQQKDKPSFTSTSPAPAILLALDTLDTRASFPRSSTFGQSQVRNPIRAADPLANPESPFVFVGVRSTFV